MEEKGARCKMRRLEHGREQEGFGFASVCGRAEALQHGSLVPRNRLWWAVSDAKADLASDAAVHLRLCMCDCANAAVELA